MHLERRFRLVVAIDFGTSRSGYAYAFSKNKRIQSRISWPDLPYKYPKTLTHLLYAPEGSVDSWGATARYKLAQLRRDQESGYEFFTNFKMDLRENKKSRGPVSYGSSGHQVRTQDLIADYLRFIKDIFFEEIRELVGTSLRDDEIQWCLTVPAIWSDGEKQIMRLASQAAGLISEKPSDEDRLLFTLEPEAAALHCQHNCHIDLPPSTRFMIVDCGGGTVDITSYEVLKDRGLKQLVTSGGGAYGSRYVDQQFQKYLRSKIGNKAIDLFTQTEPVEYLNMMESWERIKCGFDPVRNADTTYLNFPIKLYKIISTENPAVLKQLDAEQGDSETLHLERKTIVSFFDPVLKGIVACVRNQFEAMNQRECDYLFMVGGFSSSPLLKECIRNHFDRWIKQGIVVPELPGGAIVEGAVAFGLDPQSIRSRRSSRTYGCGYSPRFREGVDPEDKRFRNEETGVDHCRDRFGVFVSINQEVMVDEEVIQIYYPLESQQKKMFFKFYATEEPSPEYVDGEGVLPLGEITVDMSDTTGGRDRAVEVAMYFGRTEIAVKAVDQTSAQEHETTLHLDQSV